MTTTRQISFAKGELAPALQKRVDQVAYATGLKTLKNFYILKHGGVTNRPGTSFICEVADSSIAARIIPFEFNTSQTYVLELSNLNLRPIRNEVPIRETAKNITDITAANPPVVTSAGHGYSNGDDVYISGVVGMTELNGRTFKVANAGATYTLQDLGGTDIDASGYTAYSSGGTSEKVYEITTVFATAELFNMNYTQSKDVITFANVNYRPQELTRTDHDSWTIGNKAMAPEADTPTNFAGPAGTHTKYKLTGVADITFEESLPTSALQAGSAEPTPDVPIQLTWTGTADARVYRVYREVNEVFGFLDYAGTNYFDDIGLIPDTTDTPPDLRDPFSTSNNYPGCVGYFQQRLAFGNTNNNPQTIYASRSGLFKNFTISTPIQDDDSLTIPLDGRKVNRIKHILELNYPVIFTDTGHFILQGDAGGAVTPFAINIRQQGFNGCSDVPPLVAGSRALFIQARNSIVRDLDFDDLSQKYSGKDLTIFSAHLFENLSIVDWAYQETPHSIIWAVRSDGVLLSLTYIPEHDLWGWAKHETDGTFESVCVIPGTLEDDVYFVVNRTIDSRTVRYIEKLNTRVITNIEDSIFLDCATTTDGTNSTAITMTLSGGTDWTEGEELTITASSGYFASTNVGDQIWLTGSDGEVCRFSLSAYTSTTVMTGFANETVASSLQATATATWGLATKTITNLWHLEGEDVAVFADGHVMANPNNADYGTALTVSGGSITLPNHAQVVQVGIPYTSDLETLDIDTYERPLTGKAKLISEVDVSFENTRGVFIGGKPPDDDDTDNKEGLYELKLRADEDYDEPNDLFTDTKKIKIENTWNKTGHIFLRQIDPLPITVLAITPTGLLTAK